MTANLTGRVALVTGAGGGIGAAYARHLASLGADVVLADINDAAAAEQAAAIGGSATGRKVDVASEESTLELARSVVDEHGRIDILVNNAAIFQGVRSTAMDEIDVGYWRRMWEVNVTGVFLMTRAALPGLRQSAAAAVVNQASTATYKNSPGFLHYCGTKAAVVALTKGMARELGPQGIRVNAIAPGVVETDASVNLFGGRQQMSEAGAVAPLGRAGTTADVVGALEFLVGDQAGWITGQTIVVDGGVIMLG